MLSWIIEQKLINEVQ